MRHTPHLLLLAAACFAAVGCEDPPPTGPTPDKATASASASSIAIAASATATATAAAIPSPSASATATASAVSSASPATTASAVASPSATPPPPSPTTTPKPTPPKPAPSATAATPKPSSAPVASTGPAKPKPTAPLGPAAPNSADALAEQVDKIYQPVVRFRAAFTQKYVAKVAGKTKKSSGVLYVLRPGKLSFRYHDPNKNRVVSDGTTLKVYEHENQQLFQKKVANTEYPGALAFIMGKGLRANFTFTFHKTAKFEGGHVIVGKPREANPGYEMVLFYVDDELLKKGDPACIRRVLVVDAQSNRNRFDFVRVVQPDEIPAKEFKFTPPAGTKILK